MTTEQVKKRTGLGISTITKYARLLNIKYYGEGKRKVFDWNEENINELRKFVQKPRHKIKK